MHFIELLLLFFILLDFVAFGLLLGSFCVLLLSSFCLLLLSSFCLLLISSFLVAFDCLFYIIYPIISNWDSGYLTPNVEYILNLLLYLYSQVFILTTTLISRIKKLTFFRSHVECISLV